MSLRTILDILWRHKWLMLGVIVVTMLAVPLRLLSTQGTYTGTVKLLVTVPEQTSVDLFTSYRQSSAADEINIARNNFVDVLESGETRRRVITSLNLPDPLHDYDVRVRVSRETDFLTVDFTTIDGQWAAQIANEHIAQARQYFGEIRAQPAALAKLALAAQVSEATQQLNQAQQALVDFKNQYNIASIEAEHSLQMNTLNQLYTQRRQAEEATNGASLAAAFPELLKTLESQRSQALVRNDFGRAAAWDEVLLFASNQILEFSRASTDLPAQDRLANMITELEARQAAGGASAEAYGFVAAYYSGQLVQMRNASASLALVNEHIAETEAKIAQLNELTPQYIELQTRADQARANLLNLSEAYQEAVIKEDTALRADFIQVVLPAAVYTEASHSTALGLIALGLAGSIGAALALAFLAEVLGRWLWPAEPALERRRT
jgi:uncharacterized protein involved in exopolysaccharide biosynthesis